METKHVQYDIIKGVLYKIVYNVKENRIIKKYYSLDGKYQFMNVIPKA